MFDCDLSLLFCIYICDISFWPLTDSDPQVLQPGCYKEDVPFYIAKHPAFPYD